MGWPVEGWTLGEISGIVGGVESGGVGARYLRPVPVDAADPEGVAFAESAAFLDVARDSGVGAVLIPPDAEYDRPCVRVPAPRLAFLALLSAYADRRPAALGVAATAIVSPDAVFEPGVTVGPGCVIGPGCRVGEGTVLGPHVTLVEDVRIGAWCRIHSGTVIGADGFGFFWDGARHVKIPQVGGVLIGDDVEIGANCCIDRATCGDTVIGSGTKIDNLVQIGHNSRIGNHVVIAGCTAIAGSVTLGDGVVIGGLTAVSDHVNISSGVRIGGMTGVTKDVNEAGDYFGIPARPAREHMRILALTNRLRGLFDRVDRIEGSKKDRLD